jgi:4-carboxymuconolactone decarboxylase
VPPVWVDELLLQSLLMVGWPRTLNAAGSWRRLGSSDPAVGEDGTDYARSPEWLARGDAVCHTVYGNSYERLRDNMRALHPAIEAWMVVEGYGKTLGRSGLDLPRRELCVVAQLSVQGAKRQLHAQMRGALNAGAGPGAVTAALEAIRSYLGPRELDLAFSLWRRIHR